VTDQQSQREAARKQRERRLAAQLRENLKKRKAQARARQSPAPEPDDR
jgi:hypothetical protein